MHDNDIILSGDGQLDIEAASEGRKPRIRTAPAYAGGKLDIAWMWEGERLPVIIDLETLNASTGLPFVLNHDIKKPMGTIDTIAKTATELRAEGPLTHDHTPYHRLALTCSILLTGQGHDRRIGLVPSFDT